MYKMTEVIYKIYCKDKTITDCYVGSTNNFNKRCNYHINICNNQNSESYNSKVYKFIREHKGFDNFIIEPIIECDEENRYDAEVHYFLKLNAKLNTFWPRRSSKQYYIDNKEQILERQRQHYNENRERISEQKKTKIECECGSLIRRADISTHKKTKKHLNYISTK